jgi:hypothetical protein
MIAKGNNSSIQSAQTDMSRYYIGGSIGVIVSGIVWLLVAIISIKYNTKLAVWSLLIGGMFIHPVGMMICRVVEKKAVKPVNNICNQLAMQSTLFMVVCLPIAYGLSFQTPEWFFLSMMLIIGGRYFTFVTIYGNKLYWFLGFVLVIMSYFLFKTKAIPSIILVISGIIEILVGLLLFYQFKKTNQSLVRNASYQVNSNQ